MRQRGTTENTEVNAIISARDPLWKTDWTEARKAFTNWWAHKGLAVYVTAPKDEPWENIPEPDPNASLQTRWLDVDYWAQATLARMARTFFGGVAFPSFNTNIGGPGSLGLFLGAEGVPAETTLWYEPCIRDPETHPPLQFDPTNQWWKLHLAMIEEAFFRCERRYLIGFPDLIENIDTLAQLRDPQMLLLDLVERPAWVKAKIAEINKAFFECYDHLWAMLRDPWGGSAFCAFALWGPGRVCKVQCDFSCMISPEMFREFVVPALTEQCKRLDYAMYHLDGTQAMKHLNALLEIEALDAIEWTPQAGIPGGGSSQWFDMYRRIKAAGKSVQVVSIQPEEVAPLLDAVGPEGIYILTGAETEAKARWLLRQIGWKGDT